MPEIQVLDKNTIDKIAAGEVVEKPHSVVKELVENALDAGAGMITVEIKEGGTSLIRVTDNGCGMERSQIEKAFLRHSTSKIRSAEDLLTITSLGFRGEALSSISSVSQVELITKTKEEFVGSRYQVHGGERVSLVEIGAPEGTTILVRNLFYNTPARKKFLRSNTTEGNYVQGLMERLALSRPDVAFKFINNNQIKLQTPGNGKLKDVIYQIYGREVASNLLEVSFDGPQGQIRGYVGKPIISRGNRQYENYFVNGRYVKSGVISRAMENAYKGFLMQHKYPFVVLLATFDGRTVDVNVHPTKMELRFSDESGVYQLFYDVVLEALRHKEYVAPITFGEKDGMVAPGREKTAVRPAVQPEQGKVEPMEMEKPSGSTSSFGEVSRARGATGKSKPPLAKPFHGKQAEGGNAVIEKLAASLQMGKEAPGSHKPPEPFEVNRRKWEQARTDRETDGVREEMNYGSPVGEQTSLFAEGGMKPSVRDELVIVGQVFDTYWIVQRGDCMFLIDQHAAHEKVIYERMMKAHEKRQNASQLLNPPTIITVSAQEAQVLSEHREQFESLGFEIEPFGGKEYAIRAVPANLLGIGARDVFLEMLDELTQNGAGLTPETVLDKIASMSCKAAVKGNMKLSPAEARALLLELMELENPYHCPHGRPVIVSMTKKELEKKFKR